MSFRYVCGSTGRTHEALDMEDIFALLHRHAFHVRIFDASGKLVRESLDTGLMNYWQVWPLKLDGGWLELSAE